MSGQKVVRAAVMFSAAMAVLFLHTGNARAVPSFARQTGFECMVCHTAFPELTPAGRDFKLKGYVLSTETKPGFLPLAAMVQASYSDARGLHDKVAPFDGEEDSQTARFNVPQQASLFYAGRIYKHLGGFVQVTYDGVANDIVLDLTDIRYARGATLDGSSLTLGLTLNNSPTVEDLWNSTPTWGFPYASSSVAPTPAAGTLIDGALDSEVGGVGAYVMWNDLLYAEASIYHSTRTGLLRPLGADGEPDNVVSDFAPYWRLALQHSWGRHYLSAGTYGMAAEVFPAGETGGPTDKFTDLALDAQYQYLTDKHMFSAHTTWIHEDQDWDASFPLGIAANSSDTLETFKVDAGYYYRGSMGTVGGAVAYFSTSGDSDSLLYSPGPVNGSRTGSPDSDGFILEADFIYLEKHKFSIQYTIYNKFNGSGSNYDGFGRDASDNNTLYLLAWFMF
jgi:hypothetical protein